MESELRTKYELSPIFGLSGLRHAQTVDGRDQPAYGFVDRGAGTTQVHPHVAVALDAELLSIHAGERESAGRTLTFEVAVLTACAKWAWLPRR